MKKTYIFGHKKPDTDSVSAAIALSYLNNKLGIFSEARILDSPNFETKYALEYFNVPCPRYLNDVKPEIKDTDYTKDCYIDIDTCILSAYNILKEIHATAIPVVDKDINFLGIIRLKDIIKYYIFSQNNTLRTSYDNIILTLNAKEILKFDENIDATYYTESEIENIIDENCIIILSNKNLLDEIINKKPKMIILANALELTDEQIQIINNNKISLIITTDNINSIIKKIDLANYVSQMTIDDEAICFKENDKVEQINFKTKNYNHSDYPIINKEGKCLGLLQLTDLNRIYKKKVYLVDHNEITQTIDGIEDAELVGVIDHHKINPLKSLNPISFINKPYGSTNSIVYELFKENEIEIPKHIAGMMLSGILSDTLIFKSPTTTPKDIKYAQILADIAEVDLEKYGMDMIISGSELNNKSIDEILFEDFKDFTVEENRIGVSQIITMNIDKILNDKDEYINLMNILVDKHNYELLLFCATDLIKEGSYIFFNDKAKDILKLSLEIPDIEQGTFLPGVVSRKKQIIPKIIRYIEKR